jgi:hypothetical protein
MILPGRAAKSDTNELGEPAMALASPDVGGRVTAPATSLKPKRHRSWSWDRSFARGNVWQAA